MNYLAPKILASIVTALMGLTAFLEAPRGQSEPTTVDVNQYLIVPATTVAPTSSTSSTIYIDPYTSACEQFSALAVNLGWDRDQRTVLESVMKRESNCVPAAHNKTHNKDKSQDYGLLQINDRSWSKWLQRKGIIQQTSDLLHPQTNLLAGLAIYNYGVERYGFGWGPWSVK